MENKETLLKQISGLLQNAKISDEDHGGILDWENNPFFQQSADTCQFDINSASSEYLQMLNEIAEKYSFSPELLTLYQLIGKNVELYIGNFTFFTLSKIAEMKHPSKMVNIALQYAGMGWLHILAYVPEKGKFFWRMDGGSNGYDRDANYQKYQNYLPSDDELVSFWDAINGPKSWV